MKRGNYLREPVSDFGAVLEKVLLHNQSTDDVTRLAVLQLDGDTYAAVTSLERRLLATPSQRDIANGVVSIRQLKRLWLVWSDTKAQLRSRDANWYHALVAAARCRQDLDEQLAYARNSVVGDVCCCVDIALTGGVC